VSWVFSIIFYLLFFCSLLESLKDNSFLEVVVSTRKTTANNMILSSTIDDEYYFDYYSKLPIHEAMLKDKVRSLAYKDAIFENKKDFEGKVVLDVGAGTGEKHELSNFLMLFQGFLSILAAKAGAKKVYAVEGGEITKIASKIIQENGLDDVITVIRGKIEEVELPEKVDLIISEWMGILLLFEGMLESVLVARDKWLKKDGKMYPSHADIYLSLLSDPTFYKENIDFWKDVYGISMSCVIPIVEKDRFTSVLNAKITPDSLISEPERVISIDCNTITIEELKQLKGDFCFESTRDGSWDGFEGHFSVHFSGTEKKITLSTSPQDPLTHWEQTKFLFEKRKTIKKGEKINGNFLLQSSLPQAKRHLFATISIEREGKREKLIFDY